MHRDIKLENALLDRNKRLLKITDFGYAKTAADSLPKSEVGTPNYAGKIMHAGIQLSSICTSCLCCTNQASVATAASIQSLNPFTHASAGATTQGMACTSLLASRANKLMWRL